MVYTLLQRWRRTWGALCPAVCEVCGRWPDGPLCHDCQRDLAPVLPRCPGCALPLAPGLSRCADCKRSPPPWTRVLARVDYGYPWDAWIRTLKSGTRPGLARPLARLWLDDPALPALLADADVWLPIALTPQRLAQRGDNQAWALMRALARLTPTPRALPTALERAADAPILHHLGRQERLAQVPRLFTVAPHARAALAGRHVLVVDDVMTTGATLRAATLALHEAGASRVSALVVARTPPRVE